MPAQTKIRNAACVRPVSSSQKITGTDMTRPSVMKFGMLIFKGEPISDWRRRLQFPTGRCTPISRLILPVVLRTRRADLLCRDDPIAAHVAQGKALAGKGVRQALRASSIAQSHPRTACGKPGHVQFLDARR